MWSLVAPAWERHAEYVDGRSAPVTEAMVRAAKVAPGDRVLELACGPGGLGLALAALAGPTGEVVFSDLAPEMTEIAVRRAHDRSLDNVRALPADLADVPEADASFDAVVCREGLMFATDPAAAAAEMHRLLRPGGRLSVSVWGPPEDNPWLMAMFGAVTEVTGLPVPPPGIPGPFTLGSADALSGALRAGGFDPTVAEVAEPLDVRDAVEWFSRVSELAGPLALVLDSLPDEGREQIRSKACAAAEELSSSQERIVLPGLVLVASAVRAD